MRARGFTLVEALVVLSVLGVVAGIMALNLRPFSNPLDDAWVHTEGFLKLVRAKAMSTTSAYRVRQEGQRLVAEYAERCNSAQFTRDPTLALELPPEVTLSAEGGGTLQVCFSSRGYADTNAVLVLKRGGKERRLEVLLGGGVKRL